MKQPEMTVRIELDERVPFAVEALKLVVQYAAHSEAASTHGWPQCSEYDPDVPGSRCGAGVLIVDASEMCDGCAQRAALRRRKAKASIERGKIKRKMLALARRALDADAVAGGR